MTPFRRIVANFALLVCIALLMAACRTPASPCDMARPLGDCSVHFELEGENFIVCPQEPSSSACLDVTLDLERRSGPEQRRVLLAPGQCKALGRDVTSAAQSACTRYGVRPTPPP